MTFSNQMLFFFSALGAFNCFIIALYFALNAKGKKFSNYFLSLLLLMLSIRIIKSVFFYFNPQLANIFIQIGLSSCILIGPFLFLYLKSFTTNSKQNWAIHTIPFIAGITILGFFYPYVEHREIWSRWIVKGIYFQWLIYICLSFPYIQPVIKKYKEKESFKNIDVWLISIYVGVTCIWMAYSFGTYASYIVGALSFSFILYLIVLLLVFRNRKGLTLFQEKEKYKNKGIDRESLRQIEEAISLIATKELFLNPNLTLSETAEELNISTHLLSQYLNEKLGKSFTILINEYRIEKAKELLQSNNNYTIEGLGYNSGFNSKSTFFTTFKRITGKTPSEYQKLYSN